VQFGGLHYPDIEKVLNESGYICQTCFEKAGPSLQSHANGIFLRTCSHPECDVSLKNIFNSKILLPFLWKMVLPKSLQAAKK
jgi:hypothetical protein